MILCQHFDENVVLYIHYILYYIVYNIDQYTFQCRNNLPQKVVDARPLANQNAQFFLIEKHHFYWLNIILLLTPAQGQQFLDLFFSCQK